MRSRNPWEGYFRSVALFFAVLALIGLALGGGSGVFALVVLGGVAVAAAGVAYTMHRRARRQRR